MNFNIDRPTLIKLVLILFAGAALLYILWVYTKSQSETFEDDVVVSPKELKNNKAPVQVSGGVPQKQALPPMTEHFEGAMGGASDMYEVQPSDGMSDNFHSLEQSPQAAGQFQVDPTNLPKDCFPKDQLNPQDLLPVDADSKWAQSVPANQGSLGDQNFLTAGYHVGVNTVGQSLRNANRQLRSEPANPQMKVSPWLQTTIEPDSNRRPFEINAC